MKIISVEINNFRSIQNITIPFMTYGTRQSISSTGFLVGLNESGKSAILEAISLVQKGFSEVIYEKDCFLEAQENDEYIELYVNLEIENQNFYRNLISQKLNLEQSFSNSIIILSIRKNIYRDSESYDSGYEIEINKDLPFYQYIVISDQKTVTGTNDNSLIIKKLSEFNAIPEEITEKNASTFLLEGQKILTKAILETIISKELKENFDVNIPRVQFWKASPEYLINETISLEKFKDDTSISIPLRNIFHLYGKTNDEQIKQTIERALKNQARRDELQNKISSDITRHVNKIWQEHKIKIRVSINGSDCQVLVEDKDKEFAYYKMNQRSDGFKQFISLILSLSTQNVSKNLTKNIILIDEPEVHLHPSGVRYMRDEILKIGKNNSILVATHSHYMVDTECPERHWIVTKNKTKTSISQISEDTPIEDDAVLASAFGLNLFKELLPKHIIIVEGLDDKSIISYSLNKLNNKFPFSIKVARGASKAYGIASLLADEKVSAFFLFDDDKEGRDIKGKIIENYPKSFNTKNVFTLHDISNNLPLKCTIEDLIPVLFVKSFFETELETTLNLIDGSPILKQILEQNRNLRENKDKMDTLKISLSEKFIQEYDDRAKLESNAPQVVNFIQLFIEKVCEQC